MHTDSPTTLGSERAEGESSVTSHLHNSTHRALYKGKEAKVIHVVLFGLINSVLCFLKSVNVFSNELASSVHAIAVSNLKLSLTDPLTEVEARRCYCI